MDRYIHYTPAGKWQSSTESRRPYPRALSQFYWCAPPKSIECIGRRPHRI